MINEQSNIEVKKSLDDKEHGLCSAAETHWAIYLIWMIESGTRPQVHEGYTADGNVIQFIMKGENSKGAHFTFGADSYLIISKAVPELEYMLLVEEEADVYVGRPLTSLSDSLVINGFYDTDIPSRWKDYVADFAARRGVQPKEVTLPDLLNECLQPVS